MLMQAQNSRFTEDSKNEIYKVFLSYNYDLSLHNEQCISERNEQTGNHT